MAAAESEIYRVFKATSNTCANIKGGAHFGVSARVPPTSGVERHMKMDRRTSQSLHHAFVLSVGLRAP